VVDVFEEVDELVRSDRLFSVARRYLPWIGAVLAVAFAVALGFWAYQRYQARNTELASGAYADALDKLRAQDLNGAFTQFALAASKSSPIYKALGLMGEAGVRADQNRIPEAVDLLDQAAKAAPSPMIGDEARLKSALALLDTAPLAVVEGRLKPLTDSKRPYAALAREALAMAELKAGRTHEALGDFQVLSLMADAPDDVRNRAQVAIAVIQSGDAGGLSSAVKIAPTLPPPPPPQPAPDAAGPAPSGPSDQTQ
jgi:hypothetical protein